MVQRSLLSRSIARVAPSPDLRALSTPGFNLADPGTPQGDPGTGPRIQDPADRQAAMTQAVLDALNGTLAMGVPKGSYPVAIRGSYTDGAPAAGSTNHLLATGKIPNGFKFICRRRVSLLDTTASAVRGGVRVNRNSGTVYDGSVAPSWVTAAVESGEWVGATGLDFEWPYEFAAGDTVELTAFLVRGGAAVTCTVHAALIGSLVPAN